MRAGERVRVLSDYKRYNKPLLISFAITYVLALLSAPVTTQTLREGCLHVRALFRPPEGSYGRSADRSSNPSEP